MDNVTLRKVQLVQLEILKETVRVCEKYGISYWLAGGTQLGAVRHNGFIPWDDDLDIAMLRSEYNRFLEVAEKELDDKYLLQTWDNDPGYPLPFAKVRKKNTLFVEHNSYKTNCNHGIFIDIFPYDNYPDDAEQAKKIAFQTNVMSQFILMKCHHTPWYSNNVVNKKYWLIYLPVRFAAMFMPLEKMKKTYTETVTAADQNLNADKVFNSGEMHLSERPIKKSIVTELMPHQFEDGEFLIPIAYDDYLTTAYGNYMQLPPEEKRGNWHQVLELSFGEDGEVNGNA